MRYIDQIARCSNALICFQQLRVDTEPPPFDMNMVYESSLATTPLIFILSPGVDPQNQIQTLADSLMLN